MSNHNLEQADLAVSPPVPPPLGRLPEVLRATGAVVLLASLSLFLFRGWDGGNDVQRYLLLLLETAGLAGVSLLIGNAIKESKGARLLYSLALACIPANFAILGAFLYWPFDALGGAGPAYALIFTWAAPNSSSALLVSALGVLVLAPITWLGFRVLAPTSWQPLSGLFLLGNVALLVPVREPSLVGCLALVLAVLGARRIVSITRADRSLLALEGIVARALVAAPLAILIGRNLALHPTDAGLFLTLGLLAFGALRYLMAEILVAPWVRGLAEQLSIMAAIGTGFAAVGLLEGSLLHALALPIGGTIGFALMSELSLRAEPRAASYRMLAAGLLAVALLGNLLFVPGLAATFASLAGGIALLAFGALSEQRAAFLAGVGCAGIGLLDQFGRIIHGFDLNSWGALGLAGVIVIVLGSLLERHGAALRDSVQRWRSRYGEWQM